MVVASSYLQNWISQTNKTASLYLCSSLTTRFFSSRNFLVQIQTFWNICNMISVSQSYKIVFGVCVKFHGVIIMF